MKNGEKVSSLSLNHIIWVVVINMDIKSKDQLIGVSLYFCCRHYTLEQASSQTFQSHGDNQSQHPILL